MTKRDTITRLRVHFVEDGEGGQRIDDIEEVEIIPAHVSADYTANEINMYGIQTQLLLHVVVDKKLDASANARYEWSDKPFRLMRQVKSGNEWFATLLEISKEGR